MLGDQQGWIALLDARTNELRIFARADGPIVAFAMGDHGLWVAVGGSKRFVAEVDIAGGTLRSRRGLEAAPAAISQAP